jgi:hypothetical protein
MGDFTSIKNPAKFGARMAQCFSSTTATGRVEDNNIVRIPDITRNEYCFSDGVGKVGRIIADNIFRNFRKYNKVSIAKPSAYQFRMAGCKGVLTVDRDIPPSQIHLRPSQIKFESKHWVIEICRPSFFSPGYLNRQFITLLESLGINKQVFLDIKDEMLRQLRKIFESPSDAIFVLRQYQDEHGVSEILCTLIENGFWKDVFVVNLLRLFYAIQVRKLRL